MKKDNQPRRLLVLCGLGLSLLSSCGLSLPSSVTPSSSSPESSQSSSSDTQESKSSSDVTSESQTSSSEVSLSESSSSYEQASSESLSKEQESSPIESIPSSVESDSSNLDSSVDSTEGKLTVTFDTGDSSVVVDPILVEPGETVSKPFPLRPGYMLRRWLNKGVEFDFTSPITENIALKAEWLERTNLPTFSIELRGKDSKVFPIDEVNREEYVKSSISIMNEDGNYDHKDLVSSFKGRGNGSWEDPKKGWKLKFDKKQSLFGREANKHWVLLACTNFSDGTMLRNFSAYNMAGRLFTNLEYTTNAVWVDLFVNGEYRGVYVLCEHVRVGKGRVDISSKYGVEDTGYLIEYDAYATGIEGIDYFNINHSDSSYVASDKPLPPQVDKPSGGYGQIGIVKYPFTVHSPDPEEYESEGGLSEEQYRSQVAFIKDYVKRAYTAAITDNDLDAFFELVDLPSLIDLYILNEYYKNTDTGYSSLYMYKKPGGKLYFGPVWDFDGTTNAARGDGSATGIYVAGKVNQYSPHTANELLIKLYKNETYRKMVEARYKELSDDMASYYNDLFTEEFYEENRAALGKNFVRWSSAQNPRGGHGVTITQSQAEKRWISDCRTLKTWFDNRTNYLNSEWNVNA